MKFIKMGDNNWVNMALIETISIRPDNPCTIVLASNAGAITTTRTYKHETPEKAQEELIKILIQLQPPLMNFSGDNK